MKIESLIKRKGGSVVEMDAPSRTYHFAPVSGKHEDPHVAEVEEQSHIRSLLRIREGFRVLEGEAQQDDPVHDDDLQLVGSNIHAASYKIKGGETISLDELVSMAFQDSGLDQDQWNNASDEERYGFIDATLLELQLGDGEPEPGPVKQQEEPDVEPAATQQTEEQAPPPAQEPAAEQQELGSMPRADLSDLYQKRFGRKPSTRMTIADIANALSEED